MGPPSSHRSNNWSNRKWRSRQVFITSSLTFAKKDAVKHKTDCVYGHFNHICTVSLYRAVVKETHGLNKIKSGKRIRIDYYLFANRRKWPFNNEQDFKKRELVDGTMFLRWHLQIKLLIRVLNVKQLSTIFLRRSIIDRKDSILNDTDLPYRECLIITKVFRCPLYFIALLKQLSFFSYRGQVRIKNTHYW